jgi:osmotically-inducible protein OsmY
MHIQFRKTVFATSLAMALAALGGTAVAADNKGHADTMGQNVTEARQESQIWTTYALSPYLRASDIKVSVHDGKATLTGTVEESVNKDLAREIALGVTGITDVDNQIVVQADYVPPARSEAADRAYGEVIDDASITAAVKSKLAWSREADAIGMDVDTRRGKVTLTGNADSKAEKDKAGRLAGNTRGVVSVDNQLVVAANAKPTVKDNAKGVARDSKREVADGWITTKVKSSFMYSSNVDGSDISVNTNKGIVTLTGKVDSGAERALAIELAQNVRGVKSVQSKGLTVSNTVAKR